MTWKFKKLNVGKFLMEIPVFCLQKAHQLHLCWLPSNIGRAQVSLQLELIHGVKQSSEEQKEKTPMLFRQYVGVQVCCLLM